MNTDQLKFLEKVVDQSLGMGAVESEIMYSSSRSLSIRSFEQKIEQYNVSSSHTLGIRLRTQEKIGIGYCEALDPESITNMITDALENARWMSSDPHEHIIAAGQGESIQINKKNYESDEATIEEKIDLPKQLERLMTTRGPLVKSAPINGLSESEGEGYLVNSAGVKAYSKSRSYSCYTQALLSNGKDNMTHYKSHQARTFKGLSPESCIDETYNFAKDMLEAKRISTGRYPVVFTVEMLGAFIGAFSIAFSGRTAMEGTNPWKDKVALEVANPLLSIRDLPHFKDAFSYSLFDSEGQLHRDICLIENGVLKTFYHNSATASFFGTKSNASAARGAKSNLRVSSTTMVIDPGQTPDANVLQDGVVEIHAMQGLHSGSDSISGNFSFGAKGYIWQNGEKIPFKDITIAGNFYKLLLEIDAVGNRLHSEDSRSFFAPMVRWQGMQIAGL